MASDNLCVPSTEGQPHNSLELCRRQPNVFGQLLVGQTHSLPRLVAGLTFVGQRVQRDGSYCPGIQRTLVFKAEHIFAEDLDLWPFQEPLDVAGQEDIRRLDLVRVGPGVWCFLDVLDVEQILAAPLEVVLDPGHERCGRFDLLLPASGGSP